MVKPVVLIILSILLLISSISVILSKYYSRALFIEIQKQEQLLDHYRIRWGQLQLELSMLTAENRVEKIAKNKLKLTTPKREEIIYVKYK